MQLGNVARIVRDTNDQWGMMGPFLRSAAVLTLTALSATSVASTAAPAAFASAPTYELPAGDAVGSARQVFVDASPFTGHPDGEIVVYDLDEVLRPVSSSSMRALPDWAVAARLVLSEAGADRVVNNHYGLIEAMGIIETVMNRLDPAQWNPDGRAGVTAWPGCGQGASFASCANPQQYYGMARDRALRPASAYGDREMLLEAVDLAVSAWWLLDTHVVNDVTNGATSFAHWCGGASYGAPTGCSSTITGPIVFKGPVAWSGQGRYEIDVTQKIDYRRATGPVVAGSFARYLWSDDQVGWTGGGYASDAAALRRSDDDGAVEQDTDR
ncbi:MAG TPA: hypothetical protein PKA64_15640 [Myxococcota bacterium]|nr:hypothetical protein [Myxococcota bacterium]